jgi:DNA-binding phage protein
MGFICYAPLSKRNLGEVIMSDITGFWADLQERLTGDPEFARQYVLEWVKVSTVDRIVNELDARRQDLGLSKSDLAKAVRRDPAAIRRLLSDSTGNPTLETVSSVAAAVGLRVALVPMGNAERQVLSDPLRELVDR